MRTKPQLIATPMWIRGMAAWGSVAASSVLHLDWMKGERPFPGEYRFPKLGRDKIGVRVGKVIGKARAGLACRWLVRPDFTAFSDRLAAYFFPEQQRG